MAGYVIGMGDTRYAYTSHDINKKKKKKISSFRWEDST
jgi:hypothetical protein